ncbi:SuhB Archaeal fructose-1,6-bisphosphatase and related enzymes of inositol monophosphatase family [Candidatus Nanopelagicaceae bacterium]
MYKDLLSLAQKVGAEAGALLMDRPLAFEIESKSTAIDIATQMDIKAEKFIVESLLAARPDDGIIGEEGASIESKSGITWVIDPLDGTVNYFYGLPGWNVSIAAKDSEGVIVGVVTAPTINSTWWATRGGGAFYNGHAIKCNDPVELDRALIATGFQYDVAHRVTQLEDFSKLVPIVRDLRRNGAAAVDLCHVAMGALDGYYEAGLKEWDWSAGGLVATEAGATFRQYGQGPMRISMAAGPHLHSQLEAHLGFLA